MSACLILFFPSLQIIFGYYSQYTHTGVGRISGMKVKTENMVLYRPCSYGLSMSYENILMQQKQSDCNLK